MATATPMIVNGTADRDEPKAAATQRGSAGVSNGGSGHDAQQQEKHEKPHRGFIVVGRQSACKSRVDERRSAVD